MISQFRKHRLIYLLYGLCLLTLIFFGVHTVAYQALIIEKHSQGQNKLLDYVIELRNELKTYQILPYALTDNPALLAYIKAPENIELKQQIQRNLEDLTQVSKTQSWFVLSKQGELLISSEPSPDFVFSHYFDKKHLSERLQEQQGEHLLLAGHHAKSNDSVHLALAPVYNERGLIGAVGVRINIDKLIEGWNLFQDLVAITDKDSLLFLANKANYGLRHHWLNNKEKVQFINGTKAEVYQNPPGHFLLQSVLLDDLQWQIHYLADMKNVQTNARSIALFTLSLCALAFFFWLYRRERALKIASKRENKILMEDSAHRQRALIENTHVGLLQLTKDGKISFVNPMGLRYFGQDAQLNARHLMDFLPKRDENNYVRAFMEQFHLQQIPQTSTSTFSSNLIEQEVLFQKDDKTSFPALLSISPLEWSDSQGYLVTFVNITKRKKAEINLVEANSRLEERVLERTQALEEAQKELLRTEKLAAIGQMSAAIAHEINQPLTGIKNLTYTTELLLQRKNTEQALRTLPDLISLVVRMQKLTNGLKVFAYQRPEYLSAISVQETISAAIDNLGEDAHDTFWDLQVNKSDKVIAEATRLERIFSNLINNSLQACQESGISPKINVAVLESSASENSASESKENICIQYQDNGPGIQPDKLSHIFEPFFTTKPIGKGLGLGLAISANLAKDMNGTLTAHHDESSQLIFQLRLLKA